MQTNPPGPASASFGASRTNLFQDLHQFKVGMNYTFGAAQQAAKTMRRSANLYRKGITLTAGMGYVYGRGQFHKGLGLPHRGVRSLVSRLTYDNSPINGVDGFGRLDTKFGVPVKGLIGGGLVCGV
jgi:hypothetical protein